MNITVTWMDGQREIFRCKEWRVENGLLWLIPEPPVYAAAEPGRCIPLANVRIWLVN